MYVSLDTGTGDGIIRGLSLSKSGGGGWLIVSPGDRCGMEDLRGGELAQFCPMTCDFYISGLVLQIKLQSTTKHVALSFCTLLRYCYKLEVYNLVYC